MFIDGLLTLLAEFDNSLSGAVDALTWNIYTGEDGGAKVLSKMYSTGQDAANVLKPVAITIVSLILMIEFIKTIIRQDILKWETGFQLLAKCALAKVAFDLAPMIMEATYRTVASWINTLGGEGNVSNDIFYKALTEAAGEETMGMFMGMQVMMTMIVPILLTMLVGVFVTVIAYARVFEIIIYTAVAPIACAFLPDENSRITKKFFLSFAAVCVQGLIILIVIRLHATFLSGTIIETISGNQGIAMNSVKMLTSAVLLLVMVIKSGNIAKSLFDAA